MRIDEIRERRGRGAAITLLASVCLAALVGFAPRAQAQCEVAKLWGVGGEDGDDFGRACAITGDVVVVSDPSEEDLQGAAYVYRWDGADWNQEVRLTASDGRPNDIFGSSVAASGDVIAIGAYYWFELPYWNLGAVYVFRYSGQEWVEEAILHQSDAAAGDIFGWSVAIDGDVIVVGARDKDVDNINQAGAAYVFRYDGQNWVEETKLVPSDPQDMGLFGVSVSVAGDIAVVGAHGADSQQGAAYVFRHENGDWSQEARLTAIDGCAYDRYGAAVSISNDASTILVGSYQADGLQGWQTGAAYVYRYDGSDWPHETKLVAQNPEGPFPFFGRSVALNADGSTAMIGAVSDYAMGAESGAGYVFRYDGTAWDLGDRITASDGQAQDRFGTSVAMQEGTAVFGATGSPVFGGDGVGAAFVFAGLIAEPDCNGNGIADLCDIIDCDGSFWCSDCNENGIPDECDIANGTSFDRDDNGLPDECDPDCNGNGILDGCDISCDAGECSTLYPGECGGSADCNGNFVPDDCDIAAGTSADVNGNGIPDECEDDCNENGIPDDWDILQGTSSDCQPDGIPDECQMSLNFGPVIIDESFEAGVFPPDGWTTETLGGGGWNASTNADYIRTGLYSAVHGWNATETADSYLLTPELDVDSAALSVWSMGCFDQDWCGNYDIDVMLVVSDVGGDDDVFVARLNDLYVDYFTTWVEGFYDLTPWIPDAPYRIAFRYSGLDGDLGVIDDIVVTELYPPVNDCNRNGIPDDCDIADGTSTDVNGNGTPDECESLGDFDADGDVDLADLATLLTSYGADDGGDLDGDGDTDLADLAMLLTLYGTTYL